jgi:hypothetical protein
LEKFSEVGRKAESEPAFARSNLFICQSGVKGWPVDRRSMLNDAELVSGALQLVDYSCPSDGHVLSPSILWPKVRFPAMGRGIGGEVAAIRGCSKGRRLVTPITPMKV